MPSWFADLRITVGTSDGEQQRGRDRVDRVSDRERRIGFSGTDTHSSVVDLDLIGDPT
jgi:hypothetical protein